MRTRSGTATSPSWHPSTTQVGFGERGTEFAVLSAAVLTVYGASRAGVILEQKGVIDTLLDQFLASFSIILPYFPTGTHERVGGWWSQVLGDTCIFEAVHSLLQSISAIYLSTQVENPGDVATASTLAGIISDVKLSRSGRSPLVIFDIHALQERFYFGQNVLPLLESGIPLLRERLKKLPDQDKITIAYPDEGAWKRFHFQFSGYEEVRRVSIFGWLGAVQRGLEMVTLEAWNEAKQ